MAGRDDQPALAIDGLRFAWTPGARDTLAIDRLRVARGERVLLLGESGSGKTTLLSLVCGIVLPRAGRIAVDGIDLTALRPAARDRLRADRIGVIFQQFNLLPYASPLDNVLIALHFAAGRRARATARRSAEAEAQRLARALGLDADVLARRRAGALSVGQQQRIAAARAMIGAPSLIVADEPTSALDAANRQTFLDLLFAQCAEAGTTVLMVSHDARLAARFDTVLDMAALAGPGQEQAA